MALCGCGCGKEAGFSYWNGGHKSEKEIPRLFLSGHRKRAELHLSQLNPLRVEEFPIKNNPAFTTKVYVFKCVESGCANEVRKDNAAKYMMSTGRCRVCSKRTRPFQHVYTRLKRSAAIRGITVGLSYEELLVLVRQDYCEYCKVALRWYPYYPAIGDPLGHQAYFIDRKNSDLGYTSDNCVVCCPDCNKLKSRRLDHAEFLLLSPGLVAVRKARGVTEWSPHRR